MDAELVDPRTSSRVPVRELVEEIVDATRLYARRLGCADELALIVRLADEPPAEHQRRLANESGLPGVVAAMADSSCDSWAAKDTWILR
jgi:gamma-glutamyl:cysteine ligase YbdK (ATP-grasp superfamily)